MIEIAADNQAALHESLASNSVEEKAVVLAQSTVDAQTAPEPVQNDETQSAGELALPENEYANSVIQALQEPESVQEQDNIVQEPAESVNQAPEAVGESSSEVSSQKVQSNEPAGVDLSRLLDYNENRSRNPPKSRKPKKPKAAPVLMVPESSFKSSEKAQHYLRKVMQTRIYEQDGHNVINTSRLARTELGNMLKVNAYTPFIHPQMGRFDSVGGFWYYLVGKHPNEDFRNLSEELVRRRGSRIETIRVEGFRTLIAEATWIKVASNKRLIELMLANELPYRHYHVSGEMKIPDHTTLSMWYVPVLEEIAATLRMMKEKQDKYLPDFSFLDDEVFDQSRYVHGNNHHPE